MCARTDTWAFPREIGVAVSPRSSRGSNVGNAGGVPAEARPWIGQPWSVTLTLPPLSALVLKPGAA